MEEKGWLRGVLEQARREVNSRPEWQRSRVTGSEQGDGSQETVRTRAGEPQVDENKRKTA